MSLFILILLLAIILIGLFCLTALNNAFRTLPRKELKKKLQALGNFFFYRKLHLFAFGKEDFNDLFFASTFTQNVLRFIYAIISLFILGWLGLIETSFDSEKHTSFLALNWPLGGFSLVGFFLLFFIVGDYIPRLLGMRYPLGTINATALVSSIYLLLNFINTFIVLNVSKWVTRRIHFDPLYESQIEAKQELIEIIEESDFNNPNDKKLLASVMSFKDRIAREIMVPRVEVFSLPSDKTIEEAAILLQQEGYSRTPVYKNTLDNIIGVLMYKDVLAKYMEFAAKGDRSVLQAPIEFLVKDVLFTPETKKISILLQEVLKKQVHLAIIVDEYGGTEGIVTIEDILEEIVGNISDEYDTEEVLFVELPEGGWIVDARMSILDLEEQCGIEFLEEGDYDTVGGYIFHEAGMIPTKGFVIKKPTFDLEVIRSNDRRVEKVKIIPKISEQEAQSKESSH